MIWLLKFLIFGPEHGCKHVWGILEQFKATEPHKSGGSVVHGYKYVLQCKQCGDVTSRQLTFRP